MGNKLTDLAASIRKSTGGEGMTDEERRKMEEELARIRKENEDERQRQQDAIRKRGGY